MTLKPFLPAQFVGDVAHYWRDEADGGGTIVTQQDVGPALEYARAARLANSGWSPSKELRRVAFIPQVIRDKWLNEEGWDAYRADLFPEKLAQKLNDADYAYLRTADGRVGVTNGIIR